LTHRVHNVFAYGSNLSRERIETRVGRVETIAVGRLAAHSLRFHKIGRDGSGKADAFYTGRADDAVYGVVYAIDDRAKQKLDRIEGLGREYVEKAVTVSTDGGDVVTNVYCAHPDRIDESLLPFDWYLSFVLDGARGHGLPHAYVDRVAACRSIVDTDPLRVSREIASACGLWRRVLTRFGLRVFRRPA
jgi:gamma-glutamylcyclotransferase